MTMTATLPDASGHATTWTRATTDRGCAMKRVAMFLVWTLVAVVAGFMLLGIIAAIVGGLSGT